VLADNQFTLFNTDSHDGERSDWDWEEEKYFRKNEGWRQMRRK